MSIVGTLFVVSLGMSLKEELTLQSLLDPGSSNCPSAFGTTSALRHEGRREKVWCDSRLCFIF